MVDYTDAKMKRQTHMRVFRFQQEELKELFPNPKLTMPQRLDQLIASHPIARLKLGLQHLDKGMKRRLYQREGRPLQGKRGQQVLIGMFIVALLVVAFCLGTLFALKIYGSINTAFQASPLLPQVSKDAMQTTTNTYSGMMDKMSAFLFIGGLMGMAVLALLSVFHVVFLVFYIIITIFNVVLCAVFSQVWQQIAASPEMGLTVAQLPTMNAIMNWLPVLVFVGSIIIGIVAFKLRTWVQA